MPRDYTWTQIEASLPAQQPRGLFNRYFQMLAEGDEVKGQQFGAEVLELVERVEKAEGLAMRQLGGDVSSS